LEKTFHYHYYYTFNYTYNTTTEFVSYETLSNTKSVQDLEEDFEDKEARKNIPL